MTPNFHLIIHNVVSIASAVAMLGMAFFTFLNGTRKTANITFSLMILAGTTFIVSHVIVVNMAAPDLPRLVLVFNFFYFFIVSFYPPAFFAWLVWIKKNA